MESDGLVESAKEVHSTLGPGYSESVYHSALEHELSSRGIPFSSEGTLSIYYKGVPIGRRRPDLFIPISDGLIVVELKAGVGSGEEQLLQYIDLVEADNNFEDIQGGVLIQFGDELEVIEHER